MATNINRREFFRSVGGLLLAAAANKAVAEAGGGLLPVPVRAFGVNCFDLFYGRLFRHGGVRPASVRLRELSTRGIPFVRFAASPFWPREWSAYRDDPARYFAVLDEVIAAAESNRLGLVPSLFWNPVSVSDLVGEPVSDWGRAGSRTRAFMDKYTEQVVKRYQSSSAIWMWEFGNEFNTYANLPNALKWWPKVDVSQGTPPKRSMRDLMTTAGCADAFAHFGKIVRQLDSRRGITAGTDIPRYNVSNLAAGRWWADSPTQFRAALGEVTPDPLNVISVHLYPDREGRYFGFGNSSQFSDILREVGKTGRSLGKQVFIGEFGVPRMADRDEEKRQFRRLLDSIVAAPVNWAALWVYDFGFQEKWNVRFDNDRAWQLEWIAQANQSIKR